MEKRTTAYSFKPGSRIQADAQKVGEMCELLAEGADGLTPARLVNANRAEGTPLHGYFEWDDAKAAEGYREQQAAHVIRCVCVKAEVAGTETSEPLRAFVKAAPDEPKKYESIRVVLDDCEKSAFLLEQALSELRAFARKYRQLAGVATIISAIEELTA